MDNEMTTLKCSAGSLRLKEEIYESTACKTREVNSIHQKICVQRMNRVRTLISANI